MQEAKVIGMTGKTEQVEFVPPPTDIPKELLNKMKAYAQMLHKKYPQWKLHKIQRKTAEHFKINITDEKAGAENTTGQDQ